MRNCKKNSDCYCNGCCAALLPYFVIADSEFTDLYSYNVSFRSNSIDRDDKYFSPCIVGNLSSKLPRRDFFLYILMLEV